MINMTERIYELTEAQITQYLSGDWHGFEFEGRGIYAGNLRVTRSDDEMDAKRAVNDAIRAKGEFDWWAGYTNIIDRWGNEDNTHVGYRTRELEKHLLEQLASQVIRLSIRQARAVIHLENGEDGRAKEAIEDIHSGLYSQARRELIEQYPEYDDFYAELEQEYYDDEADLRRAEYGGDENRGWEDPRDFGIFDPRNPHPFG